MPLPHLEKKIVRKSIVEGNPRIDGRDNRTVRKIEVEVGLLSKAHGSALFTRGETQALVTTTLGSTRDAAIIDALHGSYKDNFFLHYNFPHYSVGETGFSGGPKRREIGHGRLSETRRSRCATDCSKNGHIRQELFLKSQNQMVPRLWLAYAVRVYR